MLSVLCSGSLVRDPQRRASKNAKEYCTALLRVPCEDSDALLVSIICFDEAGVAALGALRKGDAISVAGRASLRSWESNGETKHGLSVVADRVLTAYAAGKSRKQTREAEGVV